MQFSDLTYISRRFVGKVQTAENIRISVKTDMTEVLSVGVDSTVNSFEASRGEASFFGKTNVRFLYTDGTSVFGQNYNADFTASVQSDLLDADSKLTFDVNVLETKTETNANTATISVLLEISVFAYIKETTPCLEGDEATFCRTEGVEYLQSAEIFHLPLVVDEELTSTKNITTVLLAESTLCATEHTLSEGVLRLSGEAMVRLCYLSDGEIVTDALPFRFERELDATGIDPNSQLRLALFVKNTKVRLNLAQEDQNTVFGAEISATARVEAVTVGVCDVVTDAYRTDCDFDFARKSLVTTLLNCGTTETRRIAATLPSEGGSPVAVVNANADIAKCTASERRVEVQGVVQATLICNSEQGFAAHVLELPFSESVTIECATPQSVFRARATVLNISVKETGTLQAEAEICLVVEGEKDKEFSVIVAAEEIPFDKKLQPAIEVCLARKGEPLWQLCKALHVSQEDLLSANPEISDPPSSDARIVVFNKI